MLRLFEQLRELDARLVHRLTTRTPRPAPEPTLDSGWAPHVAALGGVVILLAALLLSTHTVLQGVAMAVGLLMTAPYLQEGFDRVSARARE